MEEKGSSYDSAVGQCAGKQRIVLGHHGRRLSAQDLASGHWEGLIGGVRGGEGPQVQRSEGQRLHNMFPSLRDCGEAQMLHFLVMVVQG